MEEMMMLNRFRPKQSLRIIVALLLFSQILPRPQDALALQVASDTKSLSGQVVDLAGRPVEGIAVRIPSNKVENQYETTTDAEGQFEFTLPHSIGVYSLRCLASSPDESQQGYFQPDAKATELPKNIKIEFKPAREISVIVVDDSGKPITNADILAITGHYLFTQTQSDESGRATLKIPAGLTLTAVAAAKSGAGLDYFLFQQASRLRIQNPFLLPQDYEKILRETANRLTPEEIDELLIDLKE